MRRLLAADAAYARGWRAFRDRQEALVRADAALADEHARLCERARAHGGNKLHSLWNFLRAMSTEAAQLAFHHRVTGDAVTLAGVRLRAGFLLREDDWRSQGHKNNWRSDLWTADCALGLAQAMDFASASLTDAERAAWSTKILACGVRPVLDEWIDPRRRIHVLDSMGHNWWSVCVGGASVALALLPASVEESERTRLLERVADGFVEFFNYPGNVLQNKQRTFGRAGEFIESIGYLDYTLQPLVLLFDVLRRQGRRDLPAELPGLARVCDYYLASVQPLGDRVQRINFGDMGSGSDTVGSYNHHPTPVWLWLAREYRRDGLFHLVRRAHGAPFDSTAFLLWPEDMPGESFADAPGDAIFPDIGVAILRDGHGPRDALLAVKTGEKWNHNQSDAASFILSAAGREWIFDPGTTEYSHPLHAAYFKGSLAHNVVLPDGREQDREFDDSGVKLMGTIPTRLFAPGYRYLLADACGPWEGVYQRYYRHFLWLDRFVVVVDDLQTRAAPAEWTSLLHHEGEAGIAADLSSVDLRQGEETMRVHLCHPRPSKIDFGEGHRSRILPGGRKYEYELTTKPYLRVHYAGGERRKKLIQVFALPDAPAATVSSDHRGPVARVTIATAGGTWEIGCNEDADGRVMHLNSWVKADAVETDAFLYAVKRDAGGAVERAALHNGSRLIVDGRMWFSALLKADALVEPHAGGARVQASLTAPTSVAVEAAAGGGVLERRLSAGDSVSLFG